MVNRSKDSVAGASVRIVCGFFAVSNYRVVARKNYRASVF